MSRRRDFQSILDSNVSSGRRKCPRHSLPPQRHLIAKPVLIKPAVGIPVVVRKGPRRCPHHILHRKQYKNKGLAVAEPGGRSNGDDGDANRPEEVGEEEQGRGCFLDDLPGGGNSGLSTGKEKRKDPVQSPLVTGSQAPSIVITSHGCPVHCPPVVVEQDEIKTDGEGDFHHEVSAPDPPKNERRQRSFSLEGSRRRPTLDQSIVEPDHGSRATEDNPQTTYADPPPNEPNRASSINEGHRSHSVPNILDTEQNPLPYIIEANQVDELLPASTNKITLQIDGTRIFQTTNPSVVLYQLSHPITWKSEDAFEGLTLSTMAQLPYIPSVFAGPYRICDIQILDKVYSHQDPYPQALIQSPPWGLKPPLLKFLYKENGRVMGICETNEATEKRKGHDNRNQPPSLLLAAGIFETENAVQRPKLDYPKGEYRVQWLQCQEERVMAVEMCDLVEGENGRLKRRYRLAWNRTKILFKEDVDLLVASWVTRVWMEEIYMKAMRISMKEFDKEQARKRLKTRKLFRPFYSIFFSFCD